MVMACDCRQESLPFDDAPIDIEREILEASATIAAGLIQQDEILREIRERDEELFRYMRECIAELQIAIQGLSNVLKGDL